MKKTIKIPLGSRGVNSMNLFLMSYKDYLERKVQELIDNMCEDGADYAINAVGHVDTGETVSSIVGYRQGNRGVIIAGGNAIWLEFGTGVTLNGGTHPPVVRGGGIIVPHGSYGEGHGADPSGWYYIKDGELKHTYGIEANMFMYKTAKYLADNFTDMAREVFR